VHAELDDPEESRRLLLDLLSEAAMLPEEPDFEVRVRIALAIDETEHGSPDRARLYLEEAREQASGLDARRRAIYLDVLAKSRFAAGDVEGAIRAGLEALALFHATRYELEEALLENELAMSYAALGSLDRADELVASALATAGRLGHHAAVGHITDTSATIRLARGDAAGALELAERSLAIEAEHGPPNEQLGARVTRAKALEALGRSGEAVAAWAEAGAIARSLASPARRRRILGAWAASLAAQGRHAEAYELLRDTPTPHTIRRGKASSRRDDLRPTGYNRTPRAGAAGGIGAAATMGLLLLGAMVLLGAAGSVAAVVRFGGLVDDLPNPSLLEQIELPEQSVIYDRTGTVQLATFGEFNRAVVTFDEIPPVLVDATTAVEDKTFWDNSGFDPLGIVAAGFDALRGQARGASTITQQLVRQRLLSVDGSARTEVSAERKVREIVQSIRLTQAFPGEAGKQRIMAAYLNQNYYGNESYGVKAAAKYCVGGGDLPRPVLAACRRRRRPRPRERRRGVPYEVGHSAACLSPPTQDPARNLY
jgi:tetratricopeptide (TPR) repeat protein